MAPAPSGEQFEIVHEDQRATIVEVGAGVREYAVGARPVLDPYPVEAMCDGAHGAPSIPWPNRLADGRYRFNGVDHHLALSEPERHNAIHGLLRWRPWRALEHEGERVTLFARLHPQPGYPFALEVSITYELSDEGLSVSTRAVNLGEGPCPYATGQHPYLSAGGELIDECTLQLEARTRIVTDEERKLPQGREAVARTPFDFRRPRQLAQQQIDAAFTDLTRDEDGRVSVRLTATDGSCAELWVDEGYPLIEIYTGDELAADRRRRGLGVEPMSAPPNALQSGEGLIRLDPGEEVTTRWGARLIQGVS
jgi:aldose 1-epimerase